MLRWFKRTRSSESVDSPTRQPGGIETPSASPSQPVQPQVKAAGSVPLSIHPDPKYYVQSEANPHSRIRRVIEMSDGGVLGVTGERGAGKSVLLNKLIEDYSSKYLTVNLAAPISSSREMEFFITLFRYLAQRVIVDLRSRAKRNREDIKSLGNDARRQDRLRYIALMLSLLILFFVVSGTLFQWTVQQSRQRGLQAGIDELIADEQQSVALALDVNEKILADMILAEDEWQLNVPSQRSVSHADIPRVRESLLQMEADAARENDRIERRTPGGLTVPWTDSQNLIAGRPLHLREEQIQPRLENDIKFEQTRISDLQNGKSRVDLRFQKEIDRRKAVLVELQNRKWPWLAPAGLEIVLAILIGGVGLAVFIAILPFFRSLMFQLNTEERGLLIYSERLAARLDYELTRSSERSLELSPAGWVKGNTKISRQETSRALSLPELTTSYIEFVTNVLKVFPGKLVICIDELDKVSDLDHVRFILREIKGALYVRNTFYVLSISNDALRSFEGRMGDQRDIFESTFDDVFPVRPLDLETCLEILSRRMENAPNGVASGSDRVAVLTMIALFSGGNARDLIRGFRECVLSTDKNTLPDLQAAWRILFSSRVEAIRDRSVALSAPEGLRALIVPLLEFRSDVPVDHIYQFSKCREKLHEYERSAEGQAPEVPALLQRFLRYAAEIEILLQARRAAFRLTEQGWKREASTLMRAYQLLPINVHDAEVILDDSNSRMDADLQVLNASRANFSLPLEVPVSDHDGLPYTS